MRRRALLFGVLLVGCGPGLVGDDSDEDTTQASATSTSADTSSSSSSSSTTETETETETDEGSSLTFVPDNDIATEGCGFCDGWSQDCPESEKCTYYFGEDEYSCLQCNEYGETPVGGSCMVLGTGDDCDDASWCYPAAMGLDLPSVCVELCTGIPDAPAACTNADEVCVFGDFGHSDGVGCRPRCDPSTPDACPAGERCTLGELTQRDFGCAYFRESLGPGESCHSGLQCEGGLCISDLDLPDCASLRCCASLCDPLAPDCPVGTECVLVDVDEPNSTIGVCRIPD